MPRNGLILFGDIEGKLEHLVVACKICPRWGRYNVARLIAKYGADSPIADFTDELRATCPKAQTTSMYDHYLAHCPDLAKVVMRRTPR